jgi:hypothetical protein
VKRDRREYHRALRATPGYQERERIRHQARMLDPEYAQKERARERERSVRRRATAKESINAQARKRHAIRIDTDAEYRRKKIDASYQWMKGNPVKRLVAVMRREAQKKRAIPTWSNEAQIAEMYDARRFAEEFFGVPIEVDHIVPLQSAFVCGLHVPANLRLLDSRSNKAKGNRHWPDGPNG